MAPVLRKVLGGAQGVYRFPFEFSGGGLTHRALNNNNGTRSLTPYAKRVGTGGMGVFSLSA